MPISVHTPCSQAGSSLPLSISFKPTQDCWEGLAKFMVAPDQLLIPMRVVAPGQPLPVPFALRARLTTSEVIITPTALEFGAVPATERRGLLLAVHNPSALPQTLSWGKLPAGVAIAPNDGFGVLLPGLCAAWLIM